MLPRAWKAWNFGRAGNFCSTRFRCSARECGRRSKVANDNDSRRLAKLRPTTVGADASRNNLLSQRTLLEEALSRLPLPITFLRAAWFLENAAWDVASARESGVIHSFLMPLEKPFSMVSALDVGRVAARLIREPWLGLRVVELEGPSKVSPNDLAAAFARALGRPVRAQIVPRASWEELFRSLGMKNPGPRIAMLDGFNEGWIAFQGEGANTVKGRVGVDEVVAALVGVGARVVQ